MKFFKKLATFTMALALCVGIGAAAACGGEKDDADKGYTFKVLNADGTPAVGYSVQLCTKDGVSCYQLVSIDEDGIIFYKLEDTSVDYEIHILDANQELVDEFTGIKTVTANYEHEIVITLR